MKTEPKPGRAVTTTVIGNKNVVVNGNHNVLTFGASASQIAALEERIAALETRIDSLCSVIGSFCEKQPT